MADGTSVVPVGGRGARPVGGRGEAGCLFAIFFLVVGSAFVVVGSVVLSLVGLVGGGSAPGLPQLAAFVVLVAGAIGFVAVGRLFRATASTLDELVAAARRVEGGDYGVRVEVPRRGPRPLRWSTGSTRWSNGSRPMSASVARCWPT